MQTKRNFRELFVYSPAPRATGASLGSIPAARNIDHDDDDDDADGDDDDDENASKKQRSQNSASHSSDNKSMQAMEPPNKQTKSNM